MNPTNRQNRRPTAVLKRLPHPFALACLAAFMTPNSAVVAVPPQGAIVGWGEQVVGVDLSSGFVAVAAGEYHSLGLKTDGSIVAWGSNSSGQTNVPAPNTGFVAIAAGAGHSLGLKDDGSIVAWGSDNYGQTKVPKPNTGFVAIEAGLFHSLAIRKVMGDADADGDVDQTDFALFGDNLLGPSVLPELPGWLFYDSDTDDDVDLFDLAEWQNLTTGG